MKMAAGLWQRHVRCHLKLLSLLFLALLMFGCVPFAAAQSTGGRIRGTVSDPSGASVAAATVTLINEATHATHDVQSGASGEYIFIEVPVGSYEIDVAQAGFKKYVRKGVALDLNQVASVAEADELHPFDDAASFYVKARDYPLREHRREAYPPMCGS